jgi:crotonobetainyl-CoA:carnitine CoA-transferase CaiB-like acyl-CoA transferase
MTGIVPKFSRTPGAVVATGPRLGEHTREVLRELAGVHDREWAILVKEGVVAGEQDDVRSEPKPEFGASSNL